MTPNKDKIGISIDADLLGRIDAVCRAKNEARSAWFERIASKAIDHEEEFVRDMENPLVRGLARALASSPKTLQLVATIAGEELPAEEARRIVKALGQQLELGKQREQDKKVRGVPKVA